MRRMIVPLVAAIAAGIAATPAHAGVYTVYACNAAGQNWDNRSWALAAPVGGISADQDCATGDANVGLNQNPGQRTADGSFAQLRFVAPSGTGIADFRLTKRIFFINPTQDGTHRYYVSTVLGSTTIEGAGNYYNPTRDRLHNQGRWYGYPDNNADTGIVTVSRASFPALANYDGKARTLSLRVGCWKRGTPCSSRAGAGAHVANNIRSAEVDVDDPNPPRDLTVDASGLLRGGPVNGSDPVRLKVTDPSGIRRIEIVDVTGTPASVGAEDYSTGGQTDRGGTCSFRFASPCPELNYGETMRATSLQAGRRRLVVRAVDAGGNVVERGPYTVDVATPSNRGPLNGVNATETGSITASFTRGSDRKRRVIGFLSKADVAGRLVNSAGAPIVNARVAVLTRDLDDDDAKLRTYLTTDGDGRFKYRATAYASRLYQFAWASHVNDGRYAANGYVTLRARADATLHAKPRSARIGRKVKLYGRLLGKRPHRSVDIVAQGRAGSHGAWRTFSDGHISRRGRFEVSYRFRDPSSRGRRFQFRIKIERDTGFAYYGGYSRTARVRVR